MSCTISPKQFCRAILVGLFILMGASASLPAFQGLPKEVVPDWIRGCGEQLELRLSGNIARRDGGSVDGAEVQIEINYNDRVFKITEPKVDGGRFQAWLPVNKYHWYSIIVSATCRDGARYTKTVFRQQLRGLVVDSLNLEVQRPTRQVKVRVKHAESEVANATVRAELSNCGAACAARKLSLQ